MNLALLFESLHGAWLPDPTDTAAAGSLAARIAPFRADAPTLPDWAAADIALLGVLAPAAQPAAATADAVRARLYPLKVGTGAWRLVDLGNLRPGPTAEDTVHRLAEVVELLLRHHVLPIVLGADHSLTLGQHGGYEFRPATRAVPPVSGVVIDRAFDMADGAPLPHSWLRDLLLRDPNHLATLAHLAYQRYHVTAAESAALEKMHFDVLRLGHLHANLRAAEPLLRAADWLSIDVAACAQAAVPTLPGQASPFGLNAEQLSQLTWYAGRSRQLTSAGFYGYTAAADPLGLGAMTVASAVWHLVEGFYHRPTHGPTEGSGTYAHYTVALAGSPEELLTFYHHPVAEQWWLLVEPPAAARHLLPCAEDDYLQALRGEVPHRWVQALARS